MKETKENRKLKESYIITTKSIKISGTISVKLEKYGQRNLMIL